MFRTLLAATALSLTIPSLALADDATQQVAADIGPVVGTMAPEFAAVDAVGAPATLASVSGENGAVIVFSRSLDWCPYCKKQALELEDVADDLAAAGWAMSLVTYDSPEILKAFGDKSEISYTLLSDADSVMIDAFKLRNTSMTPGSRFDGVPHPAIVWISKDGVVRGFMREDGYKDRPPSESLPQVAALLNEAGLAE